MHIFLFCFFVLETLFEITVYILLFENCLIFYLFVFFIKKDQNEEQWSHGFAEAEERIQNSFEDHKKQYKKNLIKMEIKKSKEKQI